MEIKDRLRGTSVYNVMYGWWCKIQFNRAYYIRMVPDQVAHFHSMGLLGERAEGSAYMQMLGNTNKHP